MCDKWYSTNYCIYDNDDGDFIGEFAGMETAQEAVRDHNSHKALVGVIDDLLKANEHVRTLSLNRDEPHRGMLWGEARSILDVSKLKAQAILKEATNV